MVYVRKFLILGIVAVSALSVSSCTNSDGSLTPFGRAFLSELADYFFYEGFTANALNPYFANILHFENEFNEPITAVIALNATNYLRYQFVGSGLTMIDNGDGTGDVLVDLNALEERQVRLYIQESFNTSTWQVNFPVNIFQQGQQDTDPPIGTDSIRVTGHLRPFSALDYVRHTAVDIGGTTLETELLNNIYGYSFVPRYPSPANHPAVLASGQFQVVGGYSFTGSIGGYGRDDRNLPAFPCGPIAGGGLVVCPDFPGAPSAGPFLHVGMVMDDVINLADPVNFIQYAVVFDADGNQGNNFVADPAFPNDFFQGTDLWYFLSYDPTNGWTFSTVDASGVGNPQAFFSDASAIIRGNSIHFAIPISEFPGGTTANASYRLTSFSNNGPFTMLDIYDVDYEPGLDEPLFPAPVPAP